MSNKKIDNHAKPFPSAYWVIPGLLLAGEFPGAKDQRETKEKIGRLIDCGIRKAIGPLRRRMPSGNL